MLRTIIEKEILEKILTLRFFTAFLLSIGLTTISAYVLSSDYTQELTDYHSRVKLHAETSSEQLTTVDRKPSLLGALFQGIAKNSARSVRIVPDSQPEPIETIDDNPIFVLFPTVDLTFIIGIVMSLLAILFAYDAISGEREIGTLALISSNAIKKPMLIFGKWLGGYLSLILPCFVGLLPGLLIISTHPLIQFTLADYGALGLIIIGALVYLACFFALGVLISSLTSRSSTTILALLFIWTIGVFVIPNLSPDIAKVFYPVSPSGTHIRQMRLMEKELSLQRKRNHEEAALEVIDKRLSRDAAMPLFRDIEERFMTAKKKALSNLTANYRNKVQRQEQIATGIASLSPYVCFTLFASQLAATDLGSEAKFIAATERFYNEYFPEGISLFSGPQWNEKPAFSYTEPTVNERMKSSITPLSLLLMFTALFLVGGYVAFLRYDVR
jgi:ABC-type transport system involved in multi-copper enzyme maturation permease subunit